jgi:hypothetical protein
MLCAHFFVRDNKHMTDNIEKTQSELEKGMSLAKCRKCGCMKETFACLDLKAKHSPSSSRIDLLEKRIESWMKQMERLLNTTAAFVPSAIWTFCKIYSGDILLVNIHNLHI